MVRSQVTALPLDHVGDIALSLSAEAARSLSRSCFVQQQLALRLAFTSCQPATSAGKRVGCVGLQIPTEAERPFRLKPNTTAQ
jgi:hypothetical protein